MTFSKMSCTVDDVWGEKKKKKLPAAAAGWCPD